MPNATPRCADCGALVSWYEWILLGKRRCVICEDAQRLCDALDREAKASAGTQGLPPLVARPLPEITASGEQGPVAGALSAAIPPDLQYGWMKWQPVLLVTQRRIECIRCQAAAVIVALVIPTEGTAPGPYDELDMGYRAWCQECWQRES